MSRQFIDGTIVRSKFETFSLSYLKVGDGWKASTGFIKKSVYVYKVVIRTSLSDQCKLEAIPPKKIVQGFCLRYDLDDFYKTCSLPLVDSIFVALTPAMEKRCKRKPYLAYAYKSSEFSCKNPYDMLKNKKARVCFWEHVPWDGNRLCTLGGKLIAKP